MNDFIYYNPTKVIFGRNSIEKIGNQIKLCNIKRVLVLYGGGSIKQNGVYDRVIRSLNENGIHFEEFSGVRANPTLAHAESVIDFAKKHDIEAILAVGGGSVIDEAKAVATGYYMEGLWEAFEERLPVMKALPVFTVLTLSGTSSEVDSFAVLTNENDKKKWNIAGPALFPKATAIDPSVQMTLPWHQTVNGAIDTMSHIMESHFLGTNEETTIALNESLMKTIIKCLDTLQVDPSDYSARANLAWCCSLGLCGLTGVGLGGGDWTCHRIEHAISALHPEVAHGAGLAVVFPAWIRYVNNHNTDQFLRWARNVWNCDTIDEGINKMKEKFSVWKAPVTIAQLGVSESEIPEIAANACKFGKLGVLCEIKNDDIQNILFLTK